MDDLSEKELHKLASKRKQREELQTTKAVVHARRMTRRRIRRAKDRQDHYLFLKALAVTIQTVSVLLVCIMGISAYFELEPDSESTFYATQLSIELCVLIVVFAVIVFENMLLRVLLILAFLIAFFVNIIQVLYFMLFDKRWPSCTNVSFLFGRVLCISSVLPLKHHSSFASGTLAIFHLILVIIALAVAASYQGSFSEIVENTDTASLGRSVRRRRRRRARSQGASRRRRSSQRQVRASSRSEQLGSQRRSQRSPVVVGSAQSSSAIAERREPPDSPKLSRYTKLDITKLPDGTRFKTTDNKGFNMEYYVENGVFVGSGTETLSKTISICAPIRPQRPREEPQQEASPRQSFENKNKLIKQETHNLQ